MPRVRHIVRRMVNALAYAAAGLVILLALAVGLFRLFLPRLPEYQEDIKTWANAAIGMQVEFTDMNARWRLTGPELNFYGARLMLPDTQESLIEAGEVTVGVGLLRLLVDRTLVVDRILLRDSALLLERSADDLVSVQGLPLDELLALMPRSSAANDVVFIGQDIAVNYREPDKGQGVSFEVAALEATRRDQQLSVDVSVDLEEGFGSRLDVSFEQRLEPTESHPVWDLLLEGRSLSLARWAFLLPDGVAPIESGTADISLSLRWTDNTVTNATANLLVENFSITGASRGAPVELDGRIEFARLDDGYLFDAEGLRLRTVDGDWPRSSLQATFRHDRQGAWRSLAARASYLKINDLSYFSAWLPENLRETIALYRPSGELRDLDIDVGGWQTERLSFDLNATLAGAGIGVVDSFPGIQNFSGSVRANNNGGRIESTSIGLGVQLPRYIDETAVFDEARGTLIWRRSGESLTILSDRLLLRSAELDTQSSLQISIASADRSPIVDFESTWQVNDIAAAKRFLPRAVMHPALYRWLDTALVSGTLASGRARLQGPLDRFPFDAGDGEFRLDATLENAVMRYAPDWPQANVSNMDVVLDGMRLYTERNTAAVAGNATTDARVEIADLRDPVLTIDAFSTGNLETVRQFTRQSPLVRLFGSQLDRVTVSGDASFNLLLNLPLTDLRSYDFSTRIQVSGGRIALDGFTPELSELYGIVNVSRDSVQSESLFGRFLGEPVTLGLSRLEAEDGTYNIVADVAGQVSAAALVSELNAPLANAVTGAADYAAQVRFPRAGETESLPLLITATSDLRGFDVTLPAPLDKPADQAQTLDLRIEFAAAEHIASSATLGDTARWSGDFRRREGRWDFDRGALVFGGDYPSEPESRGLHISGQVSELRFDDWLALSRGADGGVRFGDRIRSIDLAFDDLFVFGQHYDEHRVTVDRGGNRWFVKAEGPKLAGEITVPFDLSSGDPVVLDMQTLVLPGLEDDELSTAAVPSADIDPRDLPALDIKAEEFALGERFLGRVSAVFEKTADGLRADALSSSDDSFNVSGSAGWIVQPEANGAAYSFITASLKSTNVANTMRRLKYDAGIESSEMQLDVDVRWRGAPRQDFLGELDGDVTVRLGSGQLNEVEPGAGRVFGLMSVIALPRRLSLDFRDVFDKGFGFDEIRGTFRIDQGDAYTCDLSLRGPAAEIVIIGRADLANAEYEQTALVSANVGNTLPLVGTVIGGPQVGAALLIFSQIFKKPLQEVGQVYYGIDGSFDEPQVESASGARFETASELAGCLG